MGKIAVVPEDLCSRVEFLASMGIPVNYMGDFTVLGIVVDRYQEAFEILKTKGVQLESVGRGLVIEIDHSSAVPAIIEELASHRIHCQFRDLADTLYQA